MRDAATLVRVYSSDMLHLAAALLLTAVAPFVGDWSGTLEYRDFASDRTVVVPTTLTVSERDGDAHFAYTYDDGPGKIVRADDAVTFDPAAGTTGRGTIALAGTGNENGRAVEVRESIGLEPTALVLRREVRAPGGAFFTPHVYRMTRRVPAGAFRADAAIVRDTFAALHPGLARYLTP